MAIRHDTSLESVGSLFNYVTHIIKAHLGVASLNQTQDDYSLTLSLGRIASQVLFEMKNRERGFINLPAVLILKNGFIWIKHG